MGKHEEVKKKKATKKSEPEKLNNTAPETAGEESNDIFSSSTPQRASEKKADGKKAKKRKKRMSPGKRALVAFVSTLLALALLCGICFGGYTFLKNYYLRYVYVDMDEGNLGVNSENSQKHVINIALFGVDTRDGESMEGLSDSIMVLSINKKTKEMKIVSFLRDSVVDVDGKLRKINSAYSRGGYELAIKTLNENFKLDIKEFATVNFGAMANLVDMVGGVEIEVTQGEIDDKVYGINALIKEQSKITGVEPIYVNKPGLQKLDGIQAVAWARIRKSATADGQRDDFGRTDRQREVLNQLFKKATKMNFLELLSLVREFTPNVTTSLSEGEIIDLLPLIKGASLSSERIPKDYSWRIKGANVGVSSGLYYDRDFARRILKAYLYEDIPFDQYIEENGITYVPWG